MDNSQPLAGAWQLGSGQVCDSDPLAKGDNSPLSWSCPEVPAAIGVSSNDPQFLEIADRARTFVDVAGHFTQMYGPPPNCKRFEVGEG
jgi:hypothetical protein